MQQKGSFEVTYDIPPRYFLVTYHLNAENKAGDSLLKSKEYEEHRDLVKGAIRDQILVFEGETLTLHDESSEVVKVSLEDEYKNQQDKEATENEDIDQTRGNEDLLKNRK
mgnify:CR=1 FL=1